MAVPDATLFMGRTVWTATRGWRVSAREQCRIGGRRYHLDDAAYSSAEQELVADPLGVTGIRFECRQQPCPDGHEGRSANEPWVGVAELGD
jgi:hypothetical protein